MQQSRRQYTYFAKYRAWMIVVIAVMVAHVVVVVIGAIDAMPYL